MKRQEYFNFIEEKLSSLATRIEMRGGLNLLDLHLHAENFYLDFFNLLFGWNLINLNIEQPNVAGIDLVDKTNKIVVQVSATANRHKIESALNKNLSEYKDYSFKFIAISKNAENLKNKKFSNLHGLKFSPSEDIFDIPFILSKIQGMNIDEMITVYEFIKKELKNEPDLEKIESNLTTIIQILSREDWTQSEFETIPFDIEEKISYNQLDRARIFIDDHKIYYLRIDKIYSDYDKQGVNKSLSVLNGIRTEYAKLPKINHPDDIFFKIIDKVIEKIRKSSNYTPIPDEELELSVQIIVVDAFIRCKIFENPLGNTMLIPDNVHPEQTIYFNGALVLKVIQAHRAMNVIDLYLEAISEKNMSMPIFVLCLDWLFLLGLIRFDHQGRVNLCS